MPVALRPSTAWTSTSASSPPMALPARWPGSAAARARSRRGEPRRWLRARAARCAGRVGCAARLLHRLHARDPGAGRAGVDLLRAADRHRRDAAAVLGGAGRAHRAHRGLRRRDRARRRHLGAPRPDARRARARHVARADDPRHHPAAGDRAHAAGLRLDPVDHHQGHRDRRRDRRARTT